MIMLLMGVFPIFLFREHTVLLLSLLRLVFQPLCHWGVLSFQPFLTFLDCSLKANRKTRETISLWF